MSEAVTLQLVDKDNQDVCGLSAIDPRPNCGLAPALCSRMLPCCPGCPGPVLAVDQLEAALAAIQPTAAARSGSGNSSSSIKQQSSYRWQPAEAAATTTPQQQTMGQVQYIVK